MRSKNWPWTFLAQLAHVCVVMPGRLLLRSPSPQPSPQGEGEPFYHDVFKCTARDVPTNGVNWFTLSPRERDGVRGKVLSKFPLTQFLERIRRKGISRFEPVNVPGAWWFGRAWGCPGNNGLRALPSPSPRPSPQGEGEPFYHDGCKTMARDVPTNGAKWFTLSPRERDGVRGKVLSKFPLTQFLERIRRKGILRFEPVNVPGASWFGREWGCPGNNGLRALPSPSPRPSPRGEGEPFYHDGFKCIARDVSTNGAKWFTLSPRERDGVRGKGLSKFPFTLLMERGSFTIVPREERELSSVRFEKTSPFASISVKKFIAGSRR